MAGTSENPTQRVLRARKTRIGEGGASVTTDSEHGEDMNLPPIQQINTQTEEDTRASNDEAVEMMRRMQEQMNAQQRRMEAQEMQLELQRKEIEKQQKLISLQIEEMERQKEKLKDYKIKMRRERKTKPKTETERKIENKSEIQTLIEGLKECLAQNSRERQSDSQKPKKGPHYKNAPHTPSAKNPCRRVNTMGKPMVMSISMGKADASCGCR